ncbi:MAG: T9SS type A sorting domain-containing protein, partial [Calditrichia bacterium]
LLPSESADGYYLVKGEQFLRAGNSIDSLEIVLYNTVPAGGVQFKLNYDASRFVLTNAVLRGNAAAMQIFYEEHQPGSVNMIVFSPLGNTIPANNGPLLWIYFNHIGDSAQIKSPVHLSETVLSDTAGQALPLTGLNGNLLLYIDFIVGIGNEPGPKPVSRPELYPNYPNPFNTTTRFGFYLAQQNQVEFSIFDLNGRRIRLLNDRVLDAGYHEIFWDGHNNSGQTVASGTYLYRLKAGNFVQVKKMVLIK